MERVYTTPLLDKLGIRPGMRVALIDIDGPRRSARCIAERTTDADRGLAGARHRRRPARRRLDRRPRAARGPGGAHPAERRDLGRLAQGQGGHAARRRRHRRRERTPVSSTTRSRRSRRRTPRCGWSSRSRSAPALTAHGGCTIRACRRLLLLLIVILVLVVVVDLARSEDAAEVGRGPRPRASRKPRPRRPRRRPRSRHARRAPDAPPDGPAGRRRHAAGPPDHPVEREHPPADDPRRPRRPQARPGPGPHRTSRSRSTAQRVETLADLPPLRDRLLFVGLNPSPVSVDGRPLPPGPPRPDVLAAADDGPGHPARDADRDRRRRADGRRATASPTCSRSRPRATRRPTRS